MGHILAVLSLALSLALLLGVGLAAHTRWVMAVVSFAVGVTGLALRANRAQARLGWSRW